MEQISVIGIDLAKTVFELYALSLSGEVVWTKRLKRGLFMKFMDEEAPRVSLAWRPAAARIIGGGGSWLAVLR